MSLLKILLEQQGQEYKFRVYKKSRTEYRIEKNEGGRWEEIERNKSIKKVLMKDCRTVVEEQGRQKTLDNTGQDAGDVPVHAWIECNEYHIGEEISSPDGTLYYNPYTVTQFVDRDSFEDERPEVIERVKLISTDGNKLVYKGIIESSVDTSVLDNNMDLLNINESTILRVNRLFYL